MGRAHSTNGREIQRNSAAGEYSAVVAQSLAQQRRRDRPLVRKMDRVEVREYVRSRLLCYWSPDQIAARSKSDFSHDRRRRISHPTIYTWIESLPPDDRRHFATFLRRAGRPKPREDRRGRIPNQVSIEGRPKIVDQRRRYGDWAVGRRDHARRTKNGYMLTAKSCDRKARRVASKIKSRLENLPARLRRTVTFENGKEFADHERLTQQLDLGVYFAKPYCSWQRGTNEHTNGLLRPFLPKGTDLKTVS